MQELHKAAHIGLFEFIWAML